MNIPLTAIERDKIHWLVGALQGFKSLQRLFLEDRENAAWHEGVSVQRDVSRNQINNHMAPHIVVVWMHDGRSGDFDEFPSYAIIPRIGTAIRLRDESYRQTEPQNATEETENALSLLELKSLSLDGTKGENAMKHLQTLKRLYRAQV